MSALYELVIEPWTYGAWMWRGTLGGVLAAVPCAALGVYLYLRRMSMLADALAHTALLGVVLAFLLTGSSSPWAMALGALCSGLITTLSVQGLSHVKQVRSDAAVGIVFSTCFALGLALLTVYARGVHLDVQCVLFGDVLGVSDGALWLLAVVAPLVLGVVWSLRRWLELISFDAGFARHIGLPIALIHAVMMGLTSLTTVAAFEAIGAIMVVALMIVPAATAHILAQSLRGMWLWAMGVGALSAVLGMYAAVWWDVSASGAIVVVLGACFVTARLCAPRYGALARLWMRRKRAMEAKKYTAGAALDSARSA